MEFLQEKYYALKHIHFLFYLVFEYPLKNQKKWLFLDSVEYHQILLNDLVEANKNQNDICLNLKIYTHEYTKYYFVLINYRYFLLLASFLNSHKK